MICVNVYLLLKGDSLRRHLGRKFRNRDLQDNDLLADGSCTGSHKGG